MTSSGGSLLPKTWAIGDYQNAWTRNPYQPIQSSLWRDRGFWTLLIFSEFNIGHEQQPLRPRWTGAAVCGGKERSQRFGGQQSLHCGSAQGPSSVGWFTMVYNYPKTRYFWLLARTNPDAGIDFCWGPQMRPPKNRGDDNESWVYIMVFRCL